MKKLGSVEALDDFILAIAAGADVNGTWRGSPLVEYFFTESMRHIVVYPKEHPKSRRDVNMQKLAVLIEAGADVSPLFQSAYEYYEYGNLVRLISRRLDLLTIVLKSPQAQGFIKESAVYTSDLCALSARLQQIAEIIKDMHLPCNEEGENFLNNSLSN